jgi:hypothetical protein
LRIPTPRLLSLLAALSGLAAAGAAQASPPAPGFAANAEKAIQRHITAGAFTGSC